MIAIRLQNLLLNKSDDEISLMNMDSYKKEMESIQAFIKNQMNSIVFIWIWFGIESTDPLPVEYAYKYSKPEEMSQITRSTFKSSPTLIWEENREPQCI